MIQPGQRNKARLWGGYTVQKVVNLAQPVACIGIDGREVDFNPTIVKIQWDRPPSKQGHEIWFPYWQTIDGKERYGRYAPMIGETALLELLSKAIDQDFFSEDFLGQLKNKLDEKLSPNP